MTSIKQTSLDYEPKSSVKNIAELESVSTDLEVLEDNECDYPYMYIIVEDERYKVPVSVLATLKSILKERPDLENFKVNKEGSGMDTRYVVIPL